MTIVDFIKTKEKNASVETIDQVPWNIDETIQQITSLTGLQDNWDSYNALPPTKDALVGSVQLAYQLLKESTPTPDVFPVPNGNIQFEWSCFGLDIEIEIESNRKCFVNFENIETGNSWEEELTYNLTELSKIIDDLTSRSQDEHRQRIVN